MSLALLLHYLMLNMLATYLLSYFMGCIALVRGVLVLRCGLAGVVWCGVVWCCVVLCGVVWCGVMWCDIRMQAEAFVRIPHSILLFNVLVFSGLRDVVSQWRVWRDVTVTFVTCHVVSQWRQPYSKTYCRNSGLRFFCLIFKPSFQVLWLHM